MNAVGFVRCFQGHWRDSHGNAYAVSEGDDGFDIQTTFNHRSKKRVQNSRGLVKEGRCGGLLWGKSHYVVWEDADTITWWPWDSTKNRKWIWHRLNENDQHFLYNKNAIPVPPDEPPPLTAHEDEWGHL